MRSSTVPNEVLRHRSWVAPRAFAAYGNSLTDGYLVDSGVLTGAGARLLAAGTFPPSTISAPLSFKALVLEPMVPANAKHANAN